MGRKPVQEQKIRFLFFFFNPPEGSKNAPLRRKKHSWQTENKNAE